MKYVFAGDRDVSVHVLRFMINEGYPPEALMVSENNKASHAKELIELSRLPEDKILQGKDFASEGGLRLLQNLSPDYIIGIHFPYLISGEVLNIPKVGFLNLHPAYLPYNCGWHTPSWAIIDETPIGATLHFMVEQLDAGDIIYQCQLYPTPADTANTLYQKLKKLEFEIFKKAWPQLVTLNPERSKQDLEAGTSHKRKDLFQPLTQELHLQESYELDSLMRKLRGLTTNDLSEAAYFLKDGKKYQVQVQIIEVDDV